MAQYVLVCFTKMCTGRPCTLSVQLFNDTKTDQVVNKWFHSMVINGATILNCKLRVVKISLAF